jgi:hypothetical protein
MTEQESTQSGHQAGLWFRLGCLSILLLGLGLRMVSAGGDLTQDEITSVNNVNGIHHWWEVFWTIDGDNTHHLTSLYLYVLGPHAGAFARRILSILAGTLTIAAAGAWGLRRGRATALCTMALVALSPMLVDYSGVARGYAALGLFTVLLLIETEHALGHGLRPRRRMAAYTLLGFLSHLFMLFAVIGAVAWVMVQTCSRRQPLHAITAAFRVFWQSGLAVLPFAALLVWQMHDGRYLMGETIEFSTVKLIGAVSLAYQVAAILPLRLANDYLSGTLVASLLAVAQFWPQRANPRARLYLIMVLGVPALLALSHLQNISFARYVFPCATAWLLMLGDMAGWAITTGGAARWAGTGALAIVLSGDAASTGKDWHDGRGDYVAALRRMTADGPMLYGVTTPSAVKILVYGAAQYSLPARYVKTVDWCASPPDWLVDVSVSPDRDNPDPEIISGPEACPFRFALSAQYPFSGLTGIQYNLYRRQ